MTRFKRVLRYLLLVLMPALLLITMSVQGSGVKQLHEALPPMGMICTTSPTATFTLTTKTGYITIPDGNAVFMWGFSEGDKPFQHPGPVLCVNQGDTVTIVLHNTLPEDVSIIFPGQENVMANGQPSQPVFNGVGELVSLAPVAPANGGSVTYSFLASKPGTYIYESGTEPAKQVPMGLFGTIVVHPTLDPLPMTDPYTGQPIAYAYNDIGAAYNPETEYLLVISEIDPMLNMATEQGYQYNMNDYTPRYWNYNGRSFPDTVADNGAPWLPNQPYGSLVYIHPFDDQPFLADGVTPNPAYNAYPALLRHINVGTMLYSHHPHGNHGRVIAWDGHLLRSPDGLWDMSREEFTVTIAPGQSMDSLFKWTDVEKWHPVDNPIPVVIPQLQDLAVGQFYSGSPYLGNPEALPVGTQALNQCGEYYHIAHNHALNQITAWGVVLSGHITFARIDPPLPNNCQP
ncbi:MAG: multicopper oxidase domain-containing protein [Chloroflexi bacterium]|nr:multicopper oxidase domain-containing protein [Chloroflexota bacterium]